MNFDLENHFQKEEQVLAIHLPADNALVQRMFEEHEQIEALVRLGATVQDEDIFTQLADAIHNHIRFEERELFPYAEEVLPQPVMEAISSELLKEKPHSRKWENEFWVNKQ
ncbi:MAG: hemerythrin domain-containing protein [Chitinophagaceae bacterium]|nr:MAG: hemerythrin domain-containing protein [Chitinophagaceae bacterium]